MGAYKIARVLQYKFLSILVFQVILGKDGFSYQVNYATLSYAIPYFYVLLYLCYSDNFIIIRGRKKDHHYLVGHDSLKTGCYTGNILPLGETRNPDGRNKYLSIILDHLCDTQMVIKFPVCS